MPDDLVTIATFGGAPEAYLAKQVLESADIPAFLSGEQLQGTFVGADYAMGVSLLVRASDARQAVRILAEIKDCKAEPEGQAEAEARDELLEELDPEEPVPVALFDESSEVLAAVEQLEAEDIEHFVVRGLRTPEVLYVPAAQEQRALEIMRRHKVPELTPDTGPDLSTMSLHQPEDGASEMESAPTDTESATETEPPAEEPQEVPSPDDDTPNAPGAEDAEQSEPKHVPSKDNETLRCPHCHATELTLDDPGPLSSFFYDLAPHPYKPPPAPKLIRCRCGYEWPVEGELRK